MAEVVFHARAANDLDDIVRYLLGHAGAATAERVRTHLLARAAKLGTLEQLGIRSSHSSIRLLSPAKYPYRFYFTRTTERVVVLHIRHSARDLPKDLAQLLDDQ
jgi:plasmid stabilization system protein ParE